jgi:hypothetical protein
MTSATSARTSTPTTSSMSTSVSGSGASSSTAVSQQQLQGSQRVLKKSTKNTVWGPFFVKGLKSLTVTCVDDIERLRQNGLTRQKIDRSGHIIYEFNVTNIHVCIYRCCVMI